MAKKLNLRVADTPEDKGQKALSVNLIGLPESGGGGSDDSPVVCVDVTLEDSSYTASLTRGEVETLISQKKMVFLRLENVAGDVYYYTLTLSSASEGIQFINTYMSDDSLEQGMLGFYGGSDSNQLIYMPLS